jgi:hypothetical protein
MAIRFFLGDQPVARARGPESHICSWDLSGFCLLPSWLIPRGACGFPVGPGPQVQVGGAALAFDRRPFFTTLGQTTDLDLAASDVTAPSPKNGGGTLKLKHLRPHGNLVIFELALKR